ncbi:hypothetical protein [Pseudoxanthomonas daejeonensis]|uniref:Uncharacterized protein n=1 Tax=Pseudoxanthomonas daejeonensis TaxID=266062 RepID=A0ABQ6ZAH0_9GAMM|nr:hypothetical protein [Pseudoxanthomonas daejeonensis]KAF1696870.1 hypothetical protein CSC65_02190 [Pseudoxanthomonas daejeonensis]
MPLAAGHALAFVGARLAGDPGTGKPGYAGTDRHGQPSEALLLADIQRATLRHPSSARRMTQNVTF